MRSLAVSLLLTTALFSGVVMGVMLVTRLSEPAAPPDSPTIQSLRAALAKDSENEALKEALREEDQQARQSFFTHRRRLATGAYLLLAGLAATVLCARWYASLERKTPQADDAGRARGRGPLARPAAAEYRRRGHRRRRRSPRIADLRTRRRPADSAGALRRTGGAENPPAVRRDPAARGERLQGELAAVPRPRRHRPGQGRRLAAEMGRRDR